MTGQEGQSHPHLTHKQPLTGQEGQPHPQITKMSSRSQFLSALGRTRTAHVRPEDNQCPICLEKMVVAEDKNPHKRTRSRSRSPDSSERGQSSQTKNEGGNLTATLTTIVTSRRRSLNPFSRPDDFEDRRARRAVPMHGEHIACEACIRTWILAHKENNTCPLCRKVLFSAGITDEITLPSPLANIDAESLARISGSETSWAAMYAGALAEQDSSDVTFASRNIVEVLQNRLTRYRESRSVWGLRHGPYRRTVADVDTRRLTWIRRSAHEAGTVLWTYWWWPLFTATNTNGARTIVHHPVAFELLVATIQAFKRWEGNWGSYRTNVNHYTAVIRAALRPVLQRNALLHSGSIGLEPYVQDLVQAAAQAAVHGAIQTSVEKWTEEPLAEVVKCHSWIGEL